MIFRPLTFILKNPYNLSLRFEYFTIVLYNAFLLKEVTIIVETWPGPARPLTIQ